MDYEPNPNNPKLAEFIPGDLKSVTSRRVKQRAHVCKKCFHVTWRTFDTAAEAAFDELAPEPCEACGESFGDLNRLKRGWLNEAILPNFDAGKAYLPAWHKPPSLQHERYIK